MQRDAKFHFFGLTIIFCSHDTRFRDEFNQDFVTFADSVFNPPAPPVAAVSTIDAAPAVASSACSAAAGMHTEGSGASC